MSEVDMTYDLSDGDLIEGWLLAKPELEKARRTFYAFENEIVRRMGDRLSLESDKGTVVRSPQLGDYQWDKDRLRALFGDRLPAIAWMEIEAVVPAQTKMRTQPVQKWAKRLGITDAELATCYFRAEKKQDLEFHETPSMEPWEKSIEAVADHHLASVE